MFKRHGRSRYCSATRSLAPVSGHCAHRGSPRLVRNLQMAPKLVCERMVIRVEQSIVWTHLSSHCRDSPLKPRFIYSFSFFRYPNLLLCISRLLVILNGYSFTKPLGSSSACSRSISSFISSDPRRLDDRQVREVCRCLNLVQRSMSIGTPHS